MLLLRKAPSIEQPLAYRQESVWSAMKVPISAENWAHTRLIKWFWVLGEFWTGGNHDAEKPNQATWYLLYSCLVD
jgi:hypothetical protein